MITIAILAGLLVVPYAILTMADRTGYVRMEPARRGLIGLALLFLFTGIGHFTQTATMAAMLPPAVPARTEIVYITGVLELAGAAGLLVPRTSRLAAWCLIVFLVMALPANVYAAMERVPMGAHALGPLYLLARVPLQILIAWWAYYFGVKAAARRGQLTRSDT